MDLLPLPPPLPPPHCAARPAAVARTDAKTLVKILPKYAGHFAKNPRSWLPKFFGLYEIKLPGQKTQTLLVMNNWFAGRHKIEEKFDLKGSTYGREASKAELDKPGSVRKDLDWNRTPYNLEFPDKEQCRLTLAAAFPNRRRSSCARRCSRRMPVPRDAWCTVAPHCQRYAVRRAIRGSNPPPPLSLSSFLAGFAAAMAALRADVKLLAELRLIDYSLLVGVHHKVKGARYSQCERAFVRKHNAGEDLIYSGIVDILTPFSFKKFLEKFWHHRILRVDASCTDPAAYSSRFFRYIEGISVDAAPNVARRSTYSYI